MFCTTHFITRGSKAEVKSYDLSLHLEKKGRTGYGENLKITYTAHTVPYPNDKAYETVQIDGDTIITKRQYLTEGRAIILHMTRASGGVIIDSRLIFVRRVPDAEFRIMIPSDLEPYFA